MQTKYFDSSNLRLLYSVIEDICVQEVPEANKERLSRGISVVELGYSIRKPS